MIALTSISPKHINEDIQEKAVESWIALGMEVCSFNSKEEIDLLKNRFPNVKFFEVELINKKCKIDYLLDYARESEDSEFVIINSDILLFDTKGYMDKIVEVLPHSAVIAKRRDFINDINKSRLFIDGIDVFFLHKNYLHIFPKTDFVLGECWHDYQTPYTLLMNNIRVYLITENFAYHRMHNTQYSVQLWKDYAMHFMSVNGLKIKGPQTLNRYIYDFIMTRVKEL